MTNNNQTTFRPSVERRRLLIVEDEQINMEMLTMILGDDYEIFPAETGTRALELLSDEHETLSLILLDLNLPDIHGLEILKHLKSDERYQNIPVIVMTADSAAEVECLNLGAIDFIPKPYPQPAVIHARIKRTIELYEDKDLISWTERDKLTGLLNKEFFERHALQLDARHRDFPTDAILVNINRFHTVNDRYGKRYGDVVLRRIGEKLRALVESKGGLAGRGEADNFLVYCPHHESYEKVLEDVALHINREEQSENRISLRMGVYSDVDKSLDIERRFDRAKMASDTVKDSFNKSIGIYDDSMHEAELQAAQLIEDFPAAIRDHQFMIYFQPKFDVRLEEPVLNSAEALVRWNHPELGVISPGVFIPLFEKNGLIQTLDNYVWAETAAQIRDWKTRLNITLPVSVNVSRVDLYDPQLVEKLEDIVKRNGLGFSELLLEITESAYTENSEQIIAKVKQLRELGFRIEMDDFGSGYSSLNMLSTMPIDVLKLDMQFIRSAFRERKDTRLLEIMIQLAESFEVPTIAEGVETAEQMFTLKAMGCDIVQGYYFSKPLPVEEFEKYLVDNKPKTAEHIAKVKERRRDRFTYDALHDSLTGLYNHSAFEVLFYDSDKDHIAVLIAEVDDYDMIRSDKGREYADRVISRVSDVLKKNFRSVDHLCRLREKEFAIIMTRVTSEEKGLVTSKINNVNKELLETADGIEPIRISVGVAFSDREQPHGDVFQDAETALQRLKDMRQTGYAVF